MDELPRTPRVGLWAFALSAAVLLCLAGPTVGVRDAGELTTAAFAVDVAHPTGFAADMVWLRLLELFPVGDVAFRANAATALAMALAAALGARLAYAVAADLPRRARLALAALPVAALLTSRTTLRAGTATEVYALSLAAALAALSLPFRGRPGSPGPGARRRLAALALSATLMLHTGCRPAAALALGALLWRDRARLSARTAFALLACALLGALAVVYLPLAARRGGPIDWGDPRDAASLLAHLTARRIRAAYAYRMLVPWRVPEDLGRVLAVLWEDVGPALALLGAAGTLVSLRARRAAWVALAVLADVAYATLINPMGVDDRQTLFVAEAGLAVLAALALAALGERLARERDSATARRAPGLVALAAGATVLACALLSDRDWAAAADGWAADEALGAMGALGSAPPRALVLCESDDLCGAALYFQTVEGERPDVTVLPRQHLADPPTWRRARPRALGAPLPADPPGAAGEDLRVSRLRRLTARFADRLRWEAGDVDDERLAGVVLGSGETPVLAAPNAPVTAVDARALDWVRPRVAPGVGARRLLAGVLVRAGRRVGRDDLAGAVPLWQAALALDPDHAAACVNLGVAAAARGDLAGAVRWSERAVALDPDRVSAWRNLARYRDALGDPSGAARATYEARRRAAR